MTEIFADRDDLEPPSHSLTLEQVSEGADWTPIPEYMIATPEQVWAMLLKLPAEERISRLRNMLNAVEGNNRCFTTHADYDELVLWNARRADALAEVERKLISMSFLEKGPKGSIQNIVHDAVDELLTDLRKRLTGAAQ
jgi:hypothetical protein